MKKYNIVFAMSYTIEAEDETQAEEKAEEEFENDHVQVELFGVHVEELE